MSEPSIAVFIPDSDPNTKQELKLGGIVPVKHYFLINQMSCRSTSKSFTLTTT